MKIGLVGLGRMGSAMGGRLVETGCEVTAWDRDAGAMKAAAGRGVHSPTQPRAVAAAGDVVISIITEDHGVRAHLPRRGRFPVRRRDRQAVHRDEHAAADDRPRACAAGGGGGRAADRCAGARLDPDRARRQVVRAGRRARRGPRARTPGARQAHAQDRAHGRQRRRLRHEARGQSRLRRLHPGDRRIARARRARGPRPQADARRARRGADRQQLARAQEGPADGRARRHHARHQDAAQGHHVGGGDRRARRRGLPLSAGVLASLSAAVAQGWGDKDVGELARFFREQMGQRLD